MDLETLRGFADLMEERGLTRIKLEEPDLTLELEREGAGAAQPPAWPAFPPAMPAAIEINAVNSVSHARMRAMWRLPMPSTLYRPNSFLRRRARNELV